MTRPTWSLMTEAMRGGALDAVRTLLVEHPELRAFRPPSAGGGWLHVAARYPYPEIVALLLEEGFDVNEPGSLDGDCAIVRAADNGNYEVVRLLLDRGGRLDTSASVRNPLFAAIVGRSPEIVRLLMERGIDASVRYNSETMTDMDATAFALWRGEIELAQIIAQHLAAGDETKAEALLSEGRAVVSRNKPLETIRIVPNLDDLEPE